MGPSFDTPRGIDKPIDVVYNYFLDKLNLDLSATIQKRQPLSLDRVIVNQAQEAYTFLAGRDSFEGQVHTLKALLFHELSLLVNEYQLFTRPAVGFEELLNNVPIIDFAVYGDPFLRFDSVVGQIGISTLSGGKSSSIVTPINTPCVTIGEETYGSEIGINALPSFIQSPDALNIFKERFNNHIDPINKVLEPIVSNAIKQGYDIPNR